MMSDTEHSYRRGYRDGWVEAANFMMDLPRINRSAIHSVMLAHYDGPLNDWARGDTTRGDAPPAPNVREGR